MAVHGNTEQESPQDWAAAAGAPVREVDREPAVTTPSALALIFRTQYRHLIRFCRMRVRSEADAEDIVQNAFLSARRAYPDKDVDELRPLLFTLVRNHSVNHLRLHWNKLRRNGPDLDSATGLACPQTPTPERKMIDVQSLEIVDAVLAELPARQREALQLHRFDGLSYAEIASRLSVSATTVKNDVAEAVAVIASRLARDGQGPDEQI